MNNPRHALTSPCDDAINFPSVDRFSQGLYVGRSSTLGNELQMLRVGVEWKVAKVDASVAFMDMIPNEFPIFVSCRGLALPGIRIFNASGIAGCGTIKCLFKGGLSSILNRVSHLDGGTGCQVAHGGAKGKVLEVTLSFQLAKDVGFDVKLDQIIRRRVHLFRRNVPPIKGVGDADTRCQERRQESLWHGKVRRSDAPCHPLEGFRRGQ
jgi:hypothetical protein